MAYSFIPEFLERNVNNLKNLNGCLEYFNMNLKEYFIFKNFTTKNGKIEYSPMMNNLFQQIKTGRKMVSIEEMFYLDFRNIVRFGLDWNTEKLKSSTELTLKIEELKNILNQRTVLDSYFLIDGFEVKKIRLYLLKKLFKMRKGNFIKQLENNIQGSNKSIPTIERVLLHLFVRGVKEFDPYYHLPNKANIFLPGYLENVRKDEKDFFILEKGFGRLVGYSGNLEFMCTTEL